MNKSTLIVLGIAVLVIAGGFLLFLGQDDTQNEILNGADIERELQAALHGDGSAECEFTDAEGNDVYAQIRSGMIRLETILDGSRTNVIFRNDTLWVWAEGSPTGITIAVDPNDANQGMPTEEDIQQEIIRYQHHCEAVLISEERFEIPEEIEFQDFSDLEL